MRAVGREIQQGLVKLSRIGKYAADAGLQFRTDFNGGWQRGAEQLERVANDGRECDDLFLRRTLARKSENLSDKFTRSIRGAENVRKIIANGMRSGQPGAGEFGIADDADEDVVEIMRYPARQRSDGFPFFSTAQAAQKAALSPRPSDTSP